MVGFQLLAVYVVTLREKHPPEWFCTARESASLRSISKYKSTQIRLNKALIKLERLGLIENLPRQRVKFLVAR
jgi:hypothetical protein